MNSIFGRININQKSINKSLFNSGIDKLVVSHNLQKNISIKDDWGLGQVNFSPANVQDKLNHYTNNNLSIVSDSALYNKIELLGQLNISEEALSDSIIILKAFEIWGRNCVNRFIGDFSFAIWDSEKKELFCARDHFGVKPFNYYCDNECFVFSSCISGITAQNDLTFSVDEYYIADALSTVKSEHSVTTFKEIKKLPPAHYLFLKNNKLEISKYWELKPKESITKNNEEIIKEFKSLLFEAVKCRVTNLNSVGSELSGGIDSSCVTAIASQFTKLKTFSHILPDHLIGKTHPFNDERDFINLLDDYCNVSERFFIKSENNSFIDAIDQNVNEFSCITQQGFGIFSDPLYQSAMQEQVSVLLSGFGGDEAVSSKSLGYLTELAKENQWNEIKDDLKEQHNDKITFLKPFLKYYLKSKFPIIPKILRLKKSKNNWCADKFKNLALNTVFSENLNIKERFYSKYRKQSDLTLQEINIERITHSHVSQRLEYCSLIARKYGIEYRYPLLDIRLIEYYLAMPARLKARCGIGRYAIRKAIEGIVPEKIQWRNDKSGATIPTVFMRMINDKNQILDIINRSKSNEAVKQYIDLDKYEMWFQKLCNRSEEVLKNINPGAFYNYLKLILFIEKNPKFFK
jgi:asparagine synthase (glutamine-hydrolysing)